MSTRGESVHGQDLGKLHLYTDFIALLVFKGLSGYNDKKSSNLLSPNKKNKILSGILSVLDLEQQIFFKHLLPMRHDQPLQRHSISPL